MKRIQSYTKNSVPGQIMFALFAVLSVAVLGALLFPHHPEGVVYALSPIAFGKMLGKQNVTALTQDRAMWEQFQKADLVIQQSYLRLEVSLQSISSQYRFYVLTNENPIWPTEKRLAVNDCFLATKGLMYIKKAGSSATDTAVTPAEHAVANMNAWPNANIFSASNEATNLQALYSGNIRSTIDRRVYWDALDTEQFLRVGNAQQGVLYINAQATTGILRNSWEGADYGGIALTPNLLLNGQGTNEITANIAAAGVNLAGTASSNFLVLYLRGWLFQGAAILMKDQNFREHLADYFS